MRPLRGDLPGKNFIQLTATYVASLKPVLKPEQIRAAVQAPAVTGPPVARVKMFTGVNILATQASELQQILIEAGFAVLRVQPIGGGYTPDTTEVRYFHYPEDCKEAETLVEFCVRPGCAIPGRTLRKGRWRKPRCRTISRCGSIAAPSNLTEGDSRVPGALCRPGAEVQCLHPYANKLPASRSNHIRIAGLVGRSSPTRSLRNRSSAICSPRAR